MQQVYLTRLDIETLIAMIDELADNDDLTDNEKTARKKLVEIRNLKEAARLRKEKLNVNSVQTY